MRISLADSRTAGFKKWSDAQRPTVQRPTDPAAPDPEAQQQAGGPPGAGFDRPAK